MNTIVALLLSCLFAFCYADYTIKTVYPTMSPPGTIVILTGSGFTMTITGCVFTDTVTGKMYSGDYTYLSNIDCTCRVPNNAPVGHTFTISLTGLKGNSIGNFKVTSASGVNDPHFFGFHGEKMEVKRDERAANQLFHLYCSESVSIITLFYEYPDKLLFMTKFWVKLGDTLFTLDLSARPKMISSGHEGPFFLEELGRFRIDFEDGHMEWDDSKLRVVYKYLQVNFSNNIYLNNSPYMNIDIGIRNSNLEDKVTGIIGRTLHHALTDEEFGNYLPYRASVSDVINFSCSAIESIQ